MNENDVICNIKWTVADVKQGFVNTYFREPSEEELKACIKKADTLHGFLIEQGWDFIEQVCNCIGGIE